MTEKRVRLTEKYRPHRIEDFIGHPKIKAILTKFTSDPYPASFLFVGSSGVGKTTMAQAMAERIYAEVYHLGSRQCNFDQLTNLCRICESYPVFKLAEGNRDTSKLPKWPMHFVIIDEVDQVSETATYLLLSKLDSTQEVPNTIFVFTCNSLKALESRFVSRCIQLDFSEYGEKNEMSAELIAFLERVWHAEGGNGDAPNWKGVVREKGTNVRDCLQYLEAELLARG